MLWITAYEISSTSLEMCTGLGGVAFPESLTDLSNAALKGAFARSHPVPTTSATPQAGFSAQRGSRWLVIG